MRTHTCMKYTKILVFVQVSGLQMISSVIYITHKYNKEIYVLYI